MCSCMQLATGSLIAIVTSLNPWMCSHGTLIASLLASPVCYIYIYICENWIPAVSTIGLTEFCRILVIPEQHAAPVLLTEAHVSRCLGIYCEGLLLLTGAASQRDATFGGLNGLDGCAVDRDCASLVCCNQLSRTQVNAMACGCQSICMPCAHTYRLF